MTGIEAGDRAGIEAGRTAGAAAHATANTAAGITRRRLVAGLGAGFGAGFGGGLGLAGGLGPALANVTTAPRPVLRGPRRARPERDVPRASLARIEAAGLGAGFGCVVMEAHSGAVRFAAGPDTALPPASVAKAVTAAYAFDLLGPGHRFETRILATGPVRDGRLEGDLVLAGGGAPGLSTADLALLAARLKDNGLREVTGRFAIWAGALPQVREIDPSQPDHLAYNASVSGLNLNYNRVHFEWRRTAEGYTTALDARAGRYVPQVSHAAMQIAARSAPVFRYRMEAETGREMWSVARGALGGGGARWLPVRNSPLYAADVFRTLARAEGIVLPPAVPLDAPPAGTVLAAHVGPPMDEVARGMLRFSNNMTAEVLGLSATARREGARPDGLGASAGAMSAWAAERLGMTASRFVDHSGLGAEARCTPADLAGALRRLGPDGALRRALREYTLREDDGSPAPLTLYAKTGTLNYVSALAGHIRRPWGAPLVFAILTADLDRRAAIPPGQEENPPGVSAWTARSRDLQFDLVRLWSEFS